MRFPPLDVSLEYAGPDGPVTIYALVDPRDRTIRYVGQTVNMAKRLNKHRHETYPNPKVLWLRELADAKLNVIVVELERCERSLADDREKHWIERYSALGTIYNGPQRVPRATAPGLPAFRVLPHPGEILQRQFLRPLRISQLALASRLNISVQRVNELVKGKRGVTPETAWLLARAFDTSPELWMNLQTQHDLTKNRVAAEGLKFKAFV